MAEDGYPLAKLPDCHKLPHFKLWLYLRSGKSWSLEDKGRGLAKSHDRWRRIQNLVQSVIYIVMAENVTIRLEDQLIKKINLFDR